MMFGTFLCTAIYLHLEGASSIVPPTLYWFAFLLLLSCNISLYNLSKICIRFLQKILQIFFQFCYLRIHFLSEREREKKALAQSIMAHRPPWPIAVSIRLLSH